MERNSCIFYRSFYDSIKELDPGQQVQIYNAIFQYEFEGVVPELKGIVKSIFTLIVPQLEANDKRYANGCKGGRPKNQNETKTKPKNNQELTKTKPNDNVNVNENDNVNVNEYYKDKKLNNIFKEFLNIRKKLKAVNSDRAIKMLITKLDKYDDDTKYKMIEQSIVHSWKDIYELKNAKATPGWFGKDFEEQVDPQKEKELERKIRGLWKIKGFIVIY